MEKEKRNSIKIMKVTMFFMLLLVSMFSVIAYTNVAELDNWRIADNDYNGDDCKGSTCSVYPIVTNLMDIKRDFDLTLLSDNLEVLQVYEWKNWTGSYETIYSNYSASCVNVSGICQYEESEQIPYYYEHWKPINSWRTSESSTKEFKADSKTFGKFETEKFKIDFHAPLGQKYKYDVNFLDPYINSEFYTIDMEEYRYLGYNATLMYTWDTTNYDTTPISDGTSTELTAVIGEAGQFVANDEVNFYDSDVAGDYDAISMSIWVKPVQWNLCGTNTAACFEGIASFYDDNGGTNIFEISFGGYPYDRLGFWMGIDGANTFLYYPTDALLTTEYTHLVMTYDGANLRTFVNGEMTNITAKTGTLQFDTTMQQSWIGSDNSGSRDFDGDMDEFYLFARNLSNDEIQKLYNFTKPRIINNSVFDDEVIAISSSANYINITYDEDIIYEINITEIGTDLNNSGCYAVNNTNELDWSIYAVPNYSDNGISNAVNITFEECATLPNQAPDFVSVTTNPNATVQETGSIAGYCKYTDDDNLLLNYSYFWFEDGISISNGNLTNQSANDTILVNTLIASFISADSGYIFSCTANDLESNNGYHNASSVLGIAAIDTTATGTVTVAATNETLNLVMGSCPPNVASQNGLWIILIILLALGVVGMVINNFSLVITSGFMLLFFTLYSWSCGDIIGYLSILFGIMYLFSALSMKT